MASGAAVVAPVQGSVSLNPDVAYLEDPAGELTLEQVRQRASAGAFKRHGRRDAPNFGLGQSAWWLRVQLRAPSPDQRDYLLELGYFGLVDVRFYAPGEPVVATGYNQPATQRPVTHRHFVFPLTLEAEATKTFYLRVASNGSVTVPLELWEPQSFGYADKAAIAAMTAYFGLLAGLLVYNLFLFLSLRERQYGLYCLFLVALGAAMLVHNGFRAYLLLLLPGWPDTFGTNSLFAIGGLLAMAFLREFLSTARHQPRIDRVLLLWMGGFALIAAFPLFQLPVRVGSMALSIFGAITGPLLLWVTLRSWRQGYSGARYLLLAWGVLLVAASVQALRNFAILPTNFVTANLLQIGSLFEMLLLSFALADRVHSERRARERAQQRALAKERELVDGLRASEAKLESQVQQRTADLSRALDRERSTLEKYRQFANLIAHEFRNPLAIIQGQAQVARRERDYGVGEPLQRFESIEGAAGRLEQLFEQWLESDRMEKGEHTMQRQRLALSEWLPKLLAPGNLRVDHPLELTTQPATVLADEALLGNAINNLIDNAAKYSSDGSPIHVAVICADGEVGIRVRDYGVGIPAEEHNRVFEQHYRSPHNVTARGMGIGLFLVSQVMQAHGGRVTVESTPGEGSDFTLWLPAA
jgi:signal transduction histidine kinase